MFDRLKIEAVNSAKLNKAWRFWHYQSVHIVNAPQGIPPSTTHAEQRGLILERMPCDFIVPA